MDDILKLIYEANKGRRNVRNFGRRTLKAGEELGEVSEAYLYATSIENSKNKTWEDVREEAVDIILMGVDLALTPMPGDEDKTPEEIEQEVIMWVKRKLAKWEEQIALGKDCTLTEIDGLE